MIVHQKKPINAEPPGFLLTDNWITPTSLWFIRNHHPVPVVDEKNFLLTLQFFDEFDFIDDKKNFDRKNENNNIKNCKNDEKNDIVYKDKNSNSNNTIDDETAITKASKTFQFTVEDLKKNYETHTVVSSIQCGGNRRQEMNKLDITNGSPWRIGAISTAEFKGVLLRDFLLSNGLKKLLTKEELESCEHVVFESVDGVEASIPIEKALSSVGDVLIAYEMNGEILNNVHGYPLRVFFNLFIFVNYLLIIITFIHFFYFFFLRL
jgi:sulfite oxidase